MEVVILVAILLILVILYSEYEAKQMRDKTLASIRKQIAKRHEETPSARELSQERIESRKNNLLSKMDTFLKITIELESRKKANAISDSEEKRLEALLQSSQDVYFRLLKEYTELTDSNNNGD